MNKTLDKEQLNAIVRILKKLKKKCPQKPTSICDCYDAKINKSKKSNQKFCIGLVARI